MDASQKRGLQKKRTVIKARMTRIGNFVNSFQSGGNLNDIKVRKELLSTIVDEYNDIQSQLEINDSEDEAHDAHRAAVDDLCLEIQSKMETILSSVNSHPPPASNDSSSNFSTLKLPTISLPKFGGALQDFMHFHDTFEALILNNDTLSDIQRYYYLLSCVSGEPHQLIENLPVSHDNFKVAWNLIRTRYYNPRLISDLHVKELLSMPNAKHDSPKELRALINQLSSNLNAIEVLQIKTPLHELILSHLILDRISVSLRKQWENATAGEVHPRLKDLIQFLESNCQTLEIVAGSKSIVVTHGDSNNSKRSSNIKGPQRNFLTTPSSCELCNLGHPLHQCFKFRGMHVNERINLVKGHNLCFNCLRNDHLATHCKAGNCRKCNGNHHTLLHVEQPKPRMSGVTNDEAQLQSYCSVKNGYPHNEVLLSTATVNIKDIAGNTHQCRALLDSASQLNFVSQNLVERLGVQLNSHSVPINGISNVRAAESSHFCQLQIASRVCNYSTTIVCSVLDRITGPLPSSRIRYESWNLPSDVPLADPTFHQPQEIDLLLGASTFFEILKPGQQSREGHPTLQNTLLGWILAGPIPAHCVQQARSTKTALLTMRDNLHRQVERFWIQEEMAERQPSVEEILCEEHFVKTYARDKSGRFTVRLPLRRDVEELGDSLKLAEKNFGYLERRLQRQPELKKEYVKFMEDYVQLGHMELAGRPGQPHSNFYMPHHAVIKESSSTTKVRVVFNASAKTSSSVSLNDLMMVGPTIQQDLFSILLRFRTHKYALTSDVEKMYRQIQVDESDRDFQRILWRSSPHERLKSYRLTTVTYGTAAAPFLATRCLMQLAIDGRRSHPTAAEVVKQDFYVDDLLTGANTIVGAIRLQKDVFSLLKTGGFTIRKWRSNNTEILDAIPQTLREEQEPCTLPFEEGAVKTLGLNWHPSRDFFKFSIDQGTTNRLPWTKRKILATVAAIYDPLGILGPVILQCKLLIQELWQHTLEWDQVLPSGLAARWAEMYQRLPELNNISIPRRVTTDFATSVELHGFADASEKAYGACVYLRCTRSDGKKIVHLLSSKSRVAPLKQVSLPRLELNGALLLSQLMDKVSKALRLDINECYYWTDSTVVLAWISGCSSSWKTYVANRVAEIQRCTSQQAWRHVPSQDNPADIISRGTGPKELGNSVLWWAGPSWLLHDATSWPITSPITRQELPEKRKPKLCLLAIAPEVNDLLHHFSTWVKLQRVVAYVLRFIHNVRTNAPSRCSGTLAADELHNSFLAIIRLTQRSAYPSEIKNLEEGKVVSSKSKLLSLHPFLDGNSLLRVGGRLENADATFDEKHPFILPPNHHVTKLLVQHEHVRLLHAGNQLLLGSLRQRFWIVNGRCVVRKVVHKCITCFKLKANATNQLMGQLPASRVTPSKPFAHCGVDYAGPLLLKFGTPRSKIHRKCYAAMFICMSTKAVHIELVSDLSTEAFIAALRRFISRRGRCSHMFSDNGTCFTGAKKKLNEMSRLLNQQDHLTSVTDFTAREGIHWHLIPPHSPHFGGLWEAGIKSMKNHLRRVAGNTILTFEEMTTLLAQIEACMNSRPIIPIPNSPGDHSFLTPGHFLVGEPLLSFPEPDCLSGPASRLTRWQLIQRCRQLIWKRWSVDYLNNLQQRSKWVLNQPNLQTGTLVLLKEDNMPPLTWRTGIIEEVHPGADGRVRVVTLRTSKGSYKRPVTKICVFPNELQE